MAWMKETSILPFGKYKGITVNTINDKEYIDWLHHSSYNVYFYQCVLDRLQIVNKGKIKH